MRRRKSDEWRRQWREEEKNIRLRARANIETGPVCEVCGNPATLLEYGDYFCDGCQKKHGRSIDQLCNALNQVHYHRELPPGIRDLHGTFEKGCFDNKESIRLGERYLRQFGYS